MSGFLLCDQYALFLQKNNFTWIVCVFSCCLWILDRIRKKKKQNEKLFHSEHWEITPETQDVLEFLDVVLQICEMYFLGYKPTLSHNLHCTLCWFYQLHLYSLNMFIKYLCPS